MKKRFNMKRLVCRFIATALIFCAGNQTKVKAETMDKEIQLVQDWDKTFPKSEKVKHEKVTFKTQYGLTLAADLYIPKNAEGKLPAIAVSGPFGAVKEQCSGLYAQTMAERGFITIAFDPSFTGESSGEPRRTASPDINTEDFLAAVDYLSMRDDVDAGRIAIIGICGWGGIALINEIRSAVLIVHGEKAHSRYFGESAFRYMMDGKAEGYDFERKPNPVPANKQLLIIPGASHCDLYDGGGKEMIPWDNIEEFLNKNLKL